MTPRNPCQSCGACCAFFRVSFYWGEAEPNLGGTVPTELTSKLDDFRVCMQGTDQKQPRCTALSGIVGEAVNCEIYENRPSPCREFGVDWIDGVLTFVPADLERCTQARAHWGLPPLLDQPRDPFLPDTPDSPHIQIS